MAGAGFMLQFHAVFALACAVALGPSLASETPLYESGPAVLALVVGWNVAFWALAPESLRPLWRFTSVLSVFQVVPDWFLSSVLQTLHFPADGVWRVGGAVSVYMAGMWTIPLTIVLFVSGAAGKRGEPAFSQLFLAAVVSLAVFAASEQLTVPLQLWHKTDKVSVPIP